MASQLLLEVEVKMLRIASNIAKLPELLKQSFGPCHRISALRPSPKFPCLSAAPMRRFPEPWTVKHIDAGFKVIDANGQSFAYVYGYADPRDAGFANAPTLDELDA